MSAVRLPEPGRAGLPVMRRSDGKFGPPVVASFGGLRRQSVCSPDPCAWRKSTPVLRPTHRLRAARRNLRVRLRQGFLSRAHVEPQPVGYISTIYPKPPQQQDVNAHHLDASGKANAPANPEISDVTTVNLTKCRATVVLLSDDGARLLRPRARGGPFKGRCTSQYRSRLSDQGDDVRRPAIEVIGWRRRDERSSLRRRCRSLST